MSPERWRQIERIYHAVSELETGKREAVLAEACSDDEELRDEVQSLLAQSTPSSEGVFGRPVWESAASESPVNLLKAAPSQVLPGTRLGPYQVGALLGAGGMGEVFAGIDTRLDRKVAIKTCRGEFSARFEREARVVAALNHPHICQIYDVGPNYIVMEFLEGVSPAGPLPVEKALEYSGQILDALDVAHRKGITHRDLKPANILVTKQGIKLLDFGIAKRSSAIKDSGPPGTTGLTVQGQILGTVQYMSPEQLQGKEADARSDLFSFGCVLYEMLSGKKAFPPSSTAGVIAAVLEREPAPLQISPSLDRVIKTCLAKDPEKRFQNALDLKRAINWAMETNAAPVAHKRRLPWVAAAGVLACVFAFLYLRAGNPTLPETRLDIVTPPTNAPGSFALSPDGRQVAYVATGDGRSLLWIRRLDSTSAQPMPGSENARSPFWSPDSRSLGFFADSKLKRIDLAGGQPQVLADAFGTETAEGTWSARGAILFTPGLGAPIFQVPASGGTATAVTRLGSENSHRAPRFLPGGQQFLFSTLGTETGIWLGSLAGGAPRRLASLAPGNWSAAEYLAPGWLISVQQSRLVAQRVEKARGEASGDIAAIADSIAVDPRTMAGAFSVSPAGVIAYRTGTAGRRQLQWFDRAGRSAGAFGPPAEWLYNPELSPDGKRVAITRGASGAGEIWLEEGTRSTRFTFTAGNHRFSIWSPGGERLVFGSASKGQMDLYQKAADASGSEEVLLHTPDGKLPDSWSPDGRFILYVLYASQNDLMVLPLAGDRKPFPFVSTPFDQGQGTFSPDGRWVAYQSNESGRYEVYVRPFPGPGGQWQVSASGGSSPRWRADGKELYYLTPDSKLMAVAVASSGAALIAGTPQMLFQTHILVSGGRQQYDVARDGRFLINTEIDDASSEPIHLLLNWKPPGK